MGAITVVVKPQEWDRKKFEDNKKCYIATELLAMGYNDVSVRTYGAEIDDAYYAFRYQDTEQIVGSVILAGNFENKVDTVIEFIPKDVEWWDNYYN